MSKINEIQKAILELDGGSYQKLLDMYLFERYSYDNIQPRGMQLGTNKPVKGIPDSFVAHSDGEYSLIMYGTVQAQSFKKMKEDILKCLDVKQTGISIEYIKEIICCFTSTNLSPGEHKELISLFTVVKLIGIGELATDLCLKYQYIAKTMLGIALDTDQILPVSEFIRRHYESPISTELSRELIGRDEDLDFILSQLSTNDVVLIKGQSGIGKTNFALRIVEMFAEKNNYILKCILSNGLSIYEDISVHFKDTNDTIILIDDANALMHLPHIIRLTTDSARKSKTKIVLTVRDYASVIVENEIGKFAIPYVYKLSELEKDDIKRILSSRFQINSIDLVNRILNIAAGNIRLAIMAGEAYKRKEYNKIDNAIDIYKMYYLDFVNKMNDIDLKVATIIALYKVIQIKENHIGYELASLCGISENDFKEGCYKLHKQEIVDIYQDLAVSFSNESLGNYLMYYSIYESKEIPIEEIISISFPKHKERLIYMFNTVAQLFPTQENINYMCNVTKDIWNSKYKDSELQAEFMKSFQGLIPLEGLQYIKNSISKLSKEKINLVDYNFSNVNNNDIKSDLINMLGIYKHSGYLKESAELLLQHLDYINEDNLVVHAYQREDYDSKRETAQDIFLFIKNSWTIDQNSHKNDYINEIELINFLWNLFEVNEDLNVGTILIWLCEIYLQFKFSHVESDGNKGIIFSEFGLLSTNNLLSLRKYCIVILGNLYSNMSLKSQVFKTLLKYKPILNESGTNKDIIISDFKEFNTIIDNVILGLEFDECVIYYHYFTEANRVNEDTDKLRKFEKNQLFIIYLILSMSYHDGYFTSKDIGYDDFEIFKREKIRELINQNDNSAFTKMIAFMQSKNNAEINWEFSGGVRYLLEELKLKNIILSLDFYKQILYIVNDGYNSSYIVSSIENQLGFEKALEFFDNPSIPNSQMLKTKLILYSKSHKKQEKLIETLDYEPKEIKYIVSINELFEICHDNTKIIQEYVDKLDSLSKKNPNFIKEFLRPLQVEGDELDRFFVEINSGHDNKKFQRIFLFAIIHDGNFDYKNRILSFILEKDDEFLGEYVDLALKNNISDMFGKLSVIWSMQNYIKLAECIFERISAADKKEKIFLSFEKYNSFLIDSDSSNSWILSYIDTNNNQINLMRLLFNLLSSLNSDRRKLFILKYLSLNKDFNHFNQIYLFPMSKSWSGSEVPIIEEEIDFIKFIRDSLDGIDYIEHRVYLEGIIDSKNKYLKKVLYEEYLEHL